MKATYRSLIGIAKRITTKEEADRIIYAKAIHYNLIEIAKLLLENKAFPLIQNTCGGTALTHAEPENKEVIAELLNPYSKSLIESKLDFSNILNNETNIENSLESFPDGVIMTNKQKKQLEVLSGYDRNGEIKQLLNFFFVNIEQLGGFVEYKVYSYLFTSHYTELTRGFYLIKSSLHVIKKIKSKEIIPFEVKYLNTVNVMHTYCDFPAYIIIYIILYTDEIAPCRMMLLYSILKQNIQ